MSGFERRLRAAWRQHRRRSRADAALLAVSAAVCLAFTAGLVR